MKRREGRPRAPHVESYVPSLVNRAATAMLNYSATDFQKFGLTVPQWRILLTLWHHRECRFGDLVILTSIEPPTLSRLINAMAAARLVKRLPNANDLRSIKITLTAAGEATFEETIPFAKQANKLYVAGLSAEEIAALRRALTVIYENVRNAQSRAANAG